ncbi:MAG TPA: Re/Si-specific NAD(P)(+) transhydrogenase subunit alpha [Pirellulales bacterium]|jgi:NAD(P) transhydrogenase subunit alpha|nr:Re/Si-specific NAD(P)(+) transhydrogenase subunit alpha [Pirellulales bacterium]
MIAGVVKESLPGEHRVALVPAAVPPLVKAGWEVVIEPGAGLEAGFPDAAYAEKGARIAADRAEVFATADAVLQVRALGANLELGVTDLELVRPGQILIGFCDPLTAPAAAQQIAARGGVLFAMELVPRITRAQCMDALSSMASIAGYKAVLLAAATLPKIFPMMMTAAGALSPAKVFVVGAGVAGLQAIATARRIGAVVEAYDVRPVVKEQVESLGARFLDLPLETSAAQDRGGYAKQLDESVYQRQRELMLKAMAGNDVVITTAAIPGKKAPILVTAEMVRAMAPGSVIVDLAAERGGNCELTRPDETVVDRGVTVLGPTNLAATVPLHASQMYARNITTFLMHLAKEGKFEFDLSDEITRETLVTRDGEVVHPRVREALGLPVDGVGAASGGG